MQTTAWHDIEDIQNLTKNEFKYKEDTRKLINALIDTEIQKKGIDPSRIILGGFSQGAAMAIFCGLQYKQKLGGVVALSGYLCDMEMVKKVKSKEIKTTPIVMYHGKNDMIVQTQYGRMSAMLLKSSGFDNTQWEEFDIPMSMNFGHNVVQAELLKVVQFVADKLPNQDEKKQNAKRSPTFGSMTRHLYVDVCTQRTPGCNRQENDGAPCALLEATRSWLAYAGGWP